MYLPGTNSLLIDTSYNFGIKVPIKKWLFDYKDVSQFESGYFIDRSSENNNEKIDFAVLPKNIDEDDKEGLA